MIELKIKNGLKLQYDEKNCEILVNGKLDKNWKPVFIPPPEGRDEPDFYGFSDIKAKKLYIPDGEVINITDEDDIDIDK